MTDTFTSPCAESLPARPQGGPGGCPGSHGGCVLEPEFQSQGCLVVQPPVSKHLLCTGPCLLSHCTRLGETVSWQWPCRQVAEPQFAHSSVCEVLVTPRAQRGENFQLSRWTSWVFPGPQPLIQAPCCPAGLTPRALCGSVEARPGRLVGRIWGLESKSGLESQTLRRRSFFLSKTQFSHLGNGKNDSLSGKMALLILSSQAVWDVGKG